MDDIEAAHRRWLARRQAELAGPESWLGLIGLFWLEPGDQAVGSGDDCPVRLPTGPQHLGCLRVEDGAAIWMPAAPNGTEVEGGHPDAAGGWHLASDHDGNPSRVVAGDLLFTIIARDGRLGVRLRDRNWAARRRFDHIPCFAFAAEWRIVARWQPLAPPLAMEVPNVSGALRTVTVEHQAVFTVDGQTVRLLPMAVDDQEIFFVFRDRSSGRETYGGGRFLKARPAVDGYVTLDFNRAFNPPCALTAFATCPLPPPENWLPFAVPAGERKP